MTGTGRGLGLRGGRSIEENRPGAGAAGRGAALLTVLANSESRAGIEPARRVLEAGGCALDAVEQGIRAVEDDPGVDSVGRGGHPRLDGSVHCDATVMDGETRQAGSVGALRGFRHPVTVARRVLEWLPHVLLVGDGAARFAREAGCEQAAMLTPERRAEHERWLEECVAPADRAGWPDVPLARYAWQSGAGFGAGGTTVILCRDRLGRIAAGASSSGWALGYPGRLGDSAVPGAGCYADSRFGACGCTHIGEMTIRCSTARTVVRLMQEGRALDSALRAALSDLGELRGGYLGPVVIHAIDVHGNPGVMATSDLGPKSAYLCWQQGMDDPRYGRATVPRG